MAAQSQNVLDRRYDFLVLFDITNGNPNGDPDAGNAPRIDPETGHGIITDVCLKRKIRNFVALSMEGKPGYEIYVKERGILNAQHERAHVAVNPKREKTSEKVEAARAWMCENFFDIRCFGAVMTTDVNCGQVRGPIQLAFARSVDPIVDLELAITRKAVTTQKEADDQIAKHGSVTGTMGRKSIVPYGLYLGKGFVSAHLARQTGFSTQDLDTFWGAVQNMFEHDRSATRGQMTLQRLWIFEHETALGNAPAQRLFDCVERDLRRPDETRPARKISDYKVPSKDEIASGMKGLGIGGVTLHERP